jgi:hypothetical protein
MAIKIDKKIVGYEVVRAQLTETTATAEAAPRKTAEVIQMHERLERPDMLLGSTYKVKTPLSEHALYVTINDVILNPGTEHEQRRPFEVFINSKNMEHFQWIVALTRIISAVFRDPRGGYFKKGGKYMPSLVAEIGDAIECHMRSIGLLKDELDDHQKTFIAEKRAEYENANGLAPADEGEFPEGARTCDKCRTKAVVQMDNCMTCLSCGESKCG